VTIVNSSGVDGMARALAAYMVRKGLPEPRVVTGEPTGEPTEVLRQGWSDPAAAEYYGRFLRVPVFTPNIFPALDDPTPIVIRIGSDAATKWAALAQVAASTLAALDAPAPEAR
jgi:hypothetical protein